MTVRAGSAADAGVARPDDDGLGGGDIRKEDGRLGGLLDLGAEDKEPGADVGGGGRKAEPIELVRLPLGGLVGRIGTCPSDDSVFALTGRLDGGGGGRVGGSLPAITGSLLIIASNPSKRIGWLSAASSNALGIISPR